MPLRPPILHARLHQPSALALCVVLCVAAGVVACGDAAGTSSPDAGPLDAAVARGDGGRDAAMPTALPRLPLPTRTQAQHCRLAGTRADELPHLAAVPAFEGVDLGPLRRLTAIAGDAEHLLAFGIDGRIHRLALQAPHAPTTVADLRAAVAVAADGRGGLLDATPAPDFERTGHVFVSYLSPAPHHLRVARLTLLAPSHGEDIAARRAVLRHPLTGFDNAGGGLSFGPGGMLYIGVGDGGAAPDRDNPAQLPGRFGGKVLRIDVSTLQADGGYAVPDDNPTNSFQPQASEVYARGLRDPASCAFGGALHAPYCLERGVLASEVNAIEPAADYGWPVVDGSACVDPARACSPFDFAGAVVRLGHTGEECGAVGAVTVGAVEHTELDGAFIYADACSGRIFAARPVADGVVRDRIGAAGGPVTGLGTGPDGALYVAHADGRISRMLLAPDGSPGSFPARLSDTGCYADTAQHWPAADLIAFDVVTPLWTDGAHKRRYIALPPGARITFTQEGAWQYPEGTILVKEFAYDFARGDGARRLPVETRFMVFQNGAWDYHNYRWDADGTDAELLLAATVVGYEVVGEGGTQQVSYAFPGAESCPICHGDDRDAALGPRTDQLNHRVRYDDGEAREQLSVLSELAIFQAADKSPLADLTDLSGLSGLPDPMDPALPLQARARSYLHANCAHCHRPGGWTSATLTLDLRFTTAFADAELCGVPIQFGRTELLRIAPGDPGGSHLLGRMLDTGFDRMPPLATSVVDAQGTALLAAWIGGLTGCPD